MALFVTKNRFRTLRERVEKLQSQGDDQQRAMRSLQLEWEETYDKIHRLFGRIAKRTAIDTPPLVPPEPTDPEYQTGIDSISAKIHQRRAAGKP